MKIYVCASHLEPVETGFSLEFPLAIGKSIHLIWMLLLQRLVEAKVQN